MTTLTLLNQNYLTKMGGQTDDSKEERTGNTGLAKVAVQCSADKFVVNQSGSPHQHLWCKSPPSPSPKPLQALVKNRTPNKTR
jgi:hypothetical protein